MYDIYAENDSTIFLGDKEQNENQEQELVRFLYRQLSGRPWASQTYLESTPISLLYDVVVNLKILRAIYNYKSAQWIGNYTVCFKKNRTAKINVT